YPWANIERNRIRRVYLNARLLRSLRRHDSGGAEPGRQMRLPFPDRRLLGRPAGSGSKGTARQRPSRGLFGLPRARVFGYQRANVRTRTVRRVARMAADVDEADHPLMRGKAQDPSAFLEVRVPVGDEIRAVAEGIGRVDEIEGHHAAGQEHLPLGDLDAFL